MLDTRLGTLAWLYLAWARIINYKLAPLAGSNLYTASRQV